MMRSLILIDELRSYYSDYSFYSFERDYTVKYLQAFKSFNPKTGAPPQRFNYQFLHLAERARAILEDCSANDIHHRLKRIDAVFKANRLDTINAWLRKSTGHNIKVYDNPVTVLQYHINNYDNSDPAYFIDNQIAPEYFAILALALIGLAKSREQEQMTYPGLEDGDAGIQKPDLMFDYLSDATEAMDCAEYLMDLKNKVKRVKKTNGGKGIKQRPNEVGRAAGNKHVIRNTILKNELVSFYENSEPKKLDHAVIQFYRGLTSTDKKVICHKKKVENAIRFLVTHLRRHEREIQQVPEHN